MFLIFAVREGFEPSRGDSINNTTLASRWSTPILLIYFLVPAHETGGCVCPGHDSDDLISPPYNLRRLRDSNPRYSFPYDGFQDRSIQPLWQASNILFVTTKVVYLCHENNTYTLFIIYLFSW